MKNKDKIKISKEKEEHMLDEIKEYFEVERGEELGDLASSIILHFITEKLAPEFYNQGVYDAHKYMSDRCDDLLTIEMK